MHFTKLERLMLINQYEILNKLNPKEADRYDEKIEILRRGYKIFYRDIIDSMSDDMPEDESLLVTGVLDMYRAIEKYKSDYPEDSEVNQNRWSHFMGFENTAREAHYLGFTRFLIKVQGSWQEQLKVERQPDDFNSHMPVVGVYTRMLDAWTSFGRTFDLSSEQVRAILQASQYPDSQR